MLVAIQFCFPRGMVLKERDPPKPLYFPVVLTAEDGTQLYGSCLTFYEQLSSQEIQELYNVFYSGEGSLPSTLLD